VCSSSSGARRCSRFRLRAAYLLEERLVDLSLGTGDPILPADPPRHYDSQLEEQFAREFRKLAPDWDVFREPEPVVAGSGLVFPDVALQHRYDASRRWLVEIVGFWTPDYVRRKLALYREARVTKLILCIDEARACDEASLPARAVIVRFRRRVDPLAVHRIVGWLPLSPGTTFDEIRKACGTERTHIEAHAHRESRSSRINGALSDIGRPPSRRFHWSDNRRASRTVRVSAACSRSALTSCCSERPLRRARSFRRSMVL
jgi:hypothetical protein